MASLTANDFAQQMVAQARMLDPSFSGEVGTPERKMIDTVAQALADNQVDLTGLQSALSIDTKYGTNLDRFTALFGFQRQQSSAATGYVVFSRNTPAPAAITIPQGITVKSNTPTKEGTFVQYITTASGSIPVNGTTSGAIPVQATITGAVGNTAANTLTILNQTGTNGSIAGGVTAVTNPNALTNGLDVEDDNSYKIRFKNTWARNLAGTESQYLALAVAGTFTTKANVIGVQSRYQEYIQVPSYDDAGYLNGAQTLSQATGGLQGNWTTALSSIPYAKQIYTNVQTFLSNGQQGTLQYFYRPGTDFQFNYPPLLNGDVVREVSTTVNGNQTLTANTPATFLVNQVTGLGFTPNGGLLSINGVVATYSGIQTSPPGFLNCTAVSTVTANNGQNIYFIPQPSLIGIQPNFTLLNVFNPSTTTNIPGLQAVSPGNVLLSEFSYVSSASRNDINHAVTNAVDVYVDGSNDVQSSCVFVVNNSNIQTFNTSSNSPWYYENYRRDGDPTKRPQLGNYITPLFQSPVDSLPDTITINGQNYYEGFHYWLVRERTTLGGSIRARDGIEWDSSLPGDTGLANIGPAGPPTPPIDADSYLNPYFPAGTAFGGISSTTPIMVNDYFYDANIVALQASLENSRQITTDVLAHQARIRYFKLDVTVMYSANANYAVVNSAIRSSVQAYLDRQYFGAVIQLSTLLEIIHEVDGVENVRWSNDLPLVPDLIRVYETDKYGNPLHGVSVDRLATNPSANEKQTLYVVGSPQGSFTLSWSDPTLPSPHVMTTAAISFTHSDGTQLLSSDIQGPIRTAATGIGVASGMYNNIVVQPDVRPTTFVTNPISSFTVTYGATGIPYLPSISQTITASNYGFDADFFLLDDELPSLSLYAVSGDTLPGMIIRPRAQNTFFRPGLS